MFFHKFNLNQSEKKMTHKYPINWFEIPASNFERAVK
ncbi:unnamed protein product, partial [marine sediment metagenome]